MNIIIAGAGDIGFHLAKLLSFENHDITVIDVSSEILEHVNTHLDISSILGDASSTATLQNANISRADLLLAVSTSEATNLVTAILGKKLGAKKTIARVNNPEFLEDSQQVIFKELGIDVLISPRKLAALEVSRLVKQVGVTDSVEFEDGRISVIGLAIDNDSKLANLSIGQLLQESCGSYAKVLAILRGHSTIIPDESSILKERDHIYFLTKTDRVNDLLQVVGKRTIKLRNLMIIGGSDIGFKTAQLLENEYNVTLVEENKARCKFIHKNLNNTLVIHGNPHNIDLLKEEGLGQMDAILGLVPDSETNIISCLLAEEMGVYKTIALVENIDYTHISQNIGIDTIINKKLIAANKIFRYVRKGNIENIASVHGVDGEIIEFKIHKNNRITRQKLEKLKFPQNAIIGCVIRGEEILFPERIEQLQLDDKIIVFALHEAISSIESMFR